MKRNIAVIAGGDSAEFEISLQTAQHIQNTLDSERYETYLVFLKGLDWHVKIEENTYPIDRHDFSFIRNENKIKFDFAYIAIHGTPGENGILQGYLELLRIPHSSCNVLSSSLSFNKHACNTYLKSLGYRLAKSVLLKKGKKYNADKIADELGLP